MGEELLYVANAFITPMPCKLGPRLTRKPDDSASLRLDRKQQRSRDGYAGDGG